MQQQNTRDSEALTESLAFKSRWNFIEQTNLFSLINTLILALLDEAWSLDQWRFPTHYLCADWIGSTSCMRVHSTRKGTQFFTSHVQLSWYLQRRQERELKCSRSGLLRNEFRIWVEKTLLASDTVTWHRQNVHTWDLGNQVTHMQKYLVMF